MMAVFLAALGVFSILFFLAGVIRIFCWMDQRYAAKLQAEYRAYVMAEEAKREFQRSLAYQRGVFYDPYD
ncbi:hypothetical protein [Xanthomonas albilineans]|uniref:Uncharacterized protein n=1 Tax=Xanthomonas albilineans (strain GPE PC73 / CFBP 7063) TaxID=380358 RepID=D2UAK3_XANAP|nr:hypothetical protein [Xanthomonas albilineans]PPU91429.1 hypothetical protein XalbCFBP2523_14790 [Xanthomonas albilineans]CBA16048.1 hypothetical protein XALC_1545 [Xanthomonas albilineans GPE PC73]